MIQTTKIWYSVRSGGDGSAHICLMESEKLCELDQTHMDEGWGEECIGWITIEHEGPITIKDDIATVESEIAEVLECYKPGEKYFETEKYEALKKLLEAKNDTDK